MKITHQDRISWLARRPKLWTGFAMETIANPVVLRSLFLAMCVDGLWPNTKEDDAMRLIKSLIPLAQDMRDGEAA